MCSLSRKYCVKEFNNVEAYCPNIIIITRTKSIIATIATRVARKGVDECTQSLYRKISERKYTYLLRSAESF